MRTLLIPALVCLVAVSCSARDGATGEGECMEHLIVLTPEQLAERSNETAEWHRLNTRYTLRRRPILPQFDNQSSAYDRVGYLRPGDRAPILSHGVQDWVRVRSPSTGATGWIQASGARNRYLNTKTLAPCEPESSTTDNR